MVFISLSLWWFPIFFIMILLYYFLVLHYGLPYGVAITCFYSSDVLVIFLCDSLWFAMIFCVFLMVFILFCSDSNVFLNVFHVFF